MNMIVFKNCVPDQEGPGTISGMKCMEPSAMAAACYEGNIYHVCSAMRGVLAFS